MTRQAFVGLLALNACYLAGGLGLLAAVRPFADRRDALRVAPLAYFLGLAACGVVLVQLAIAGLGPSRAVVSGVAGAFLVLGALVALRRNHLSGLRTGGAAAPEPLRVAGIALAALTLVVLAGLGRWAWVKPVTAWDAWAVWVPKGLALYHGDGLVLELYEGLQARTYPLFVPVLDAAAFAWMGAPSTSPLHLQYVFLAAGFLLASASLLRPLVPLVVIWPFLLLITVLPGTSAQLIRPEADFPLHYFFVLAVVATCLWIVRGEAWLLVAATAFLAAGVTTKREGLLFLLAVGLAAAIATARTWRVRWPPLFGAGVVAAAASIPWHLWLRRHGIEAESSPQIVGNGGVVGDLTDEPENVAPAIGHVLEKLFSYDLWLVAPTLGLLAVLVALVRLRDRRLVLVVLSTSAIALAGFVWRILWGSQTVGAFEEGALPTTRNVAGIVLLWCVAGALLLAMLVGRDRVWDRLRRGPGGRLPAAAALLPATLLVAVWIARGDFAWAHCDREPVGNGPVSVVFARGLDQDAAKSFRDHVVALGFIGTTIDRDLCGRLRVVLDGIPSERVGREIVAEARPAGLSPELVEP